MALERSERINRKLHRELGDTILAALADTEVIEVMLNPDGCLWVEYFGKKMEKVGEMSAASAEALMATLSATLNTTITREHPIIECELPIDGSRFEGLIPPIVARPTFTIRKKASVVFTLEDYVSQHIMTELQRHIIEEAILQRQNILVVGGTGSGKTTLTNAIIAHMIKADPTQRLVIIEDTAEIQCAAENAVILRSTDNIDMQRLLKATMRLRPDRILIGEVRGGEALALIKAWNTGHPGGVATLHANSAYSSLIRLQQLIGEVALQPMQAVIAQAIDLIIVIEKKAGMRQIAEILTVEGFDGEKNNYVINSVFNTIAKPLLTVSNGGAIL